MVEDWFKIFFI